jgi:GntR family transcriptional repressor for pyruvate dehydrogenase complex
VIHWTSDPRSLHDVGVVMTGTSLPIEPPVRRSLSQVVAEQLLDLIEQGALAPGTRLPSETALKDQFGVGRSTIREALKALAVIGVIEVRHGDGAYVLEHAPPQEHALETALRRAVTRDLLDARDAMEVAIAGYAAERATEDDLERIRELVAVAEAKVSAGGTAVEEGARFHLLLAEAAHNEICREFIEMILYKLQERGVDLSRAEGYANWEVEAHREVYDAVASGVGERARRAMARHLQDMRVISMSGWEHFRLHAATDPAHKR